MKFLKEVFSNESIFIVLCVCLIGGVLWGSWQLTGIRRDAQEVSEHITAAVDTLAETITVTLEDGSTEVYKWMRSNQDAVRALVDSSPQIQNKLKRYEEVEEEIAEVYGKAATLEGLARVKYERALKELGSVDTTAHK